MVISPDRITRTSRASTCRTPCLLEHQDVDIADRQVVQVGQTHFSLERCIERLETTLRQTALQRHLTAFEADLVETTRTRLLTFVATASGFTDARTNTTAYAALVMLGAFSWLNCIQFHCFLRS